MAGLAKMIENYFEDICLEDLTVLSFKRNIEYFPEDSLSVEMARLASSFNAVSICSREYWPICFAYSRLAKSASFRLG